MARGERITFLRREERLIRREVLPLGRLVNRVAFQYLVIFPTTIKYQPRGVQSGCYGAYTEMFYLSLATSAIA